MKRFLIIILLALAALAVQGQELKTKFTRTIALADTMRRIDTTYSENTVSPYALYGDFGPIDAYGLYYWQAALDSHMVNRLCSLWVDKQATYDGTNWTTIGGVDTIKPSLSDTGFAPHWASSPTRLKLDSIAALWNAKQFRFRLRKVITFTAGDSVVATGIRGRTYTFQLKLLFNRMY